MVITYLTWFLVPLLSLLYCDKGIFFYSFFLNYLLMFGVTYVNSFYKVTLRSDYDVAQYITVDDLEHIADARMYEDKEAYYKESGIERRHAR